MPNRTDLGPVPETMTWGKASPIFIVAGIFDALRLMCEQLWFFGPAIAAAYCTAQGSEFLAKWTLGVLGTKTAAAACSVGATVVGAYGLPIIEALGIILAIAVGLMGWLIVGLMLMTNNRRIFKENAVNTIWFAGSLLISEIPFVGTLPALSGTLFKMYRTQIRKDKAVLAEYKKKTEEARVQERQRQAANLMQMRTMQAEQEQAANDEEYDQIEAAEDETDAEEGAEEEKRMQTEAANDEDYIPEKKYGT